MQESLCMPSTTTDRMCDAPTEQPSPSELQFTKGRGTENSVPRSSVQGDHHERRLREEDEGFFDQQEKSQNPMLIDQSLVPTSLRLTPSGSGS